MDKLDIFSDGGSRRNPGPAAVGFVLKNKEGEVVERGGKFLGRATNNEAEYLALIAGLEAAQKRRTQEVVCYLDSLLVVRQLNGEYQVKEPRLQALLLKVRGHQKNFRQSSFCHIPRAENCEADKIVNEILNEREAN